LQSGKPQLLNLAGADATAKKRQVVTKRSKLFFSFLFAFVSQFTGICRDLYYVFTAFNWGAPSAGNAALDVNYVNVGNIEII
jgi:hypothetical protein